MELNFNFDISGRKEGSKLIIECHGCIDSYNGFKEFKNRFFKIAQSNPIAHYKNRAFSELDIIFIKSFPMSFDVVGFLIKLKQRDKVGINLMTDDVRVLNFFINISLDDLLNVKLF